MKVIPGDKLKELIAADPNNDYPRTSNYNGKPPVLDSSAYAVAKALVPDDDMFQVWLKQAENLTPFHRNMFLLRISKAEYDKLEVYHGDDEA